MKRRVAIAAVLVSVATVGSASADFALNFAEVEFRQAGERVLVRFEGTGEVVGDDKAVLAACRGYNGSAPITVELDARLLLPTVNRLKGRPGRTGVGLWTDRGATKVLTNNENTTEFHVWVEALVCNPDQKGAVDCDATLRLQTGKSRGPGRRSRAAIGATLRLKYKVLSDEGSGTFEGLLDDANVGNMVCIR